MLRRKRKIRRKKIRSLIDNFVKDAKKDMDALVLSALRDKSFTSMKEYKAEMQDFTFDSIFK